MENRLWMLIVSDLTLGSREEQRVLSWHGRGTRASALTLIGASGLVTGAALEISGSG
jgi:hypothetical protein